MSARVSLRRWFLIGSLVLPCGAYAAVLPPLDAVVAPAAVAPPEPPAGAGALAWEALTEAEQRVLRRFAPEWDDLPMGRRAALVQGARRWLAATPEERRRWRRSFHHWRELSPEERARWREKWESLSPEERERLRDWLREGPPRPDRPPPPNRPRPPERPPLLPPPEV